MLSVAVQAIVHRSGLHLTACSCSCVLACCLGRMPTVLTRWLCWHAGCPGLQIDSSHAILTKNEEKKKARMVMPAVVEALQQVRPAKAPKNAPKAPAAKPPAPAAKAPVVKPYVVKPPIIHRAVPPQPLGLNRYAALQNSMQMVLCHHCAVRSGLCCHLVLLLWCRALHADQTC